MRSAQATRFTGTFAPMGIFDKMKAKAAERRNAEAVAARQRAEEAELAARKRADAEAANEAERSLDPTARIQLPAWASALTSSGIEPSTIQAVLDGNGGTIFTPGSSPIGMPLMRKARVGTVVLTMDDKLAYVLRTDSGIEVVVRRRSEVAQMRKANSDGAVWVVLEGDRCFPDRGDQPGRADNWDLPVPNRDPDAIRAVFRQAGYNV